MLPVLNAAQMREADHRTIFELGVPGPVLMERAGAAVLRELRRRRPEARRVVVLCGRGNNGGDGIVVARLLGPDARCLLLGRREDVQGDARVHLGRFESEGGEIREVADAAAWDASVAEVLAADVVVDALLGTGLGSSPRGVVGHALQDLAARPRRPFVVAVDLPSGVPSDSGELPGAALPADLTVTIAAPKVGHVRAPAAALCGEIVVVDIGIPLPGSDVGLLTDADAGQAWPRRGPDGHKGTYGHVLVVGGSRGKSGAVCLAALAALRSGAGLVTAAVPVEIQDVVAGSRAELMTEGLGEGAFERVMELAATREAVVLGPGGGSDARALLSALARRCPRPMVVDADGLNALAPLTAGGWPAPRVLTPHPGEMARLLGVSNADVQRDRENVARAAAAGWDAVVVLKGHRTLVAAPDGRLAVNPTGNAGMATGGTGDVLAGMIGAVLARGVDPWAAAGAAVYLHGRAGDLATARLGPESLIAGDLVDALPEAFRSLEGRG